MFWNDVMKETHVSGSENRSLGNAQGTTAGKKKIYIYIQRV